MTESQLYEKAARLAFLAMGKEQRPNRRGNKQLYLADEDPLAHWELTERIIELAKCTGGLTDGRVIQREL